MKFPNMPSLDKSYHEVYSEEWRTQEAKDMFNLLRNEYKRSKRLNLLKRYKELERILVMFTSEPVLTKLLWFITDEIATALSTAAGPETDNNTDKEDSFSCDADVTSSWAHQPRNSQDKVLDGLKTITAKLKTAVPFASALGFIKSSTTPDLQGSTDSTEFMTHGCYCHDFNNLDSPNFNLYTPPQSCQSTPNRPLVSPSTTSTTNFFFPSNVCLCGNSETISRSPAMNRIVTEDNTNQSMSANNDKVGISTTSYTETKLRDFPVRKQGIATCLLIKRDQIPPFLIPPQQAVVQEKIPSINPSLYVDKSHANHCERFRRGCMTKAQHCRKISVSTPNMTARNGHSLGSKLKRLTSDKDERKRCCSENCIQLSSSRSPQSLGALDFPCRLDSSSALNNTSISSVNDICNDERDRTSSLVKAYGGLQQMKSEFDQLDDTNIVVRYRKMKTIIKSCMAIQI